MQPSSTTSSINSMTRFCVARFTPCVCDSEDEWVHGFTIRDGKRDGMYIAARRSSNGVRSLDVALSVGNGLGCVAVRAWVDVETRAIRCRILAPNTVDSHPAAALSGWLNRVEVEALQLDVEQLTSLLVVGDDRLAAHLFDLPTAHAPTAHALPAVPALQ